MEGGGKNPLPAGEHAAYHLRDAAGPHHVARCGLGGADCGGAAVEHLPDSSYLDAVADDAEITNHGIFSLKLWKNDGGCTFFVTGYDPQAAYPAPVPDKAPAQELTEVPRRLRPVLEQFATGYPQVKVAKVNVDEEPELARQFRVMSIPTLVLFREGKAQKRSVGALSPEDLKSFCEVE